MKVFKGIINFILGLLLFITVFILSISLVINITIKKNLLPTVIKEVLIKNINNNLNNEENENVRNKITTFIELDGFDEIIDVGVNEIIECKKDNRSVSDEAVDKFIEFIKKNKNKYQQIFEVEINDDELNSKEYRNNIKSYFNEEIKKIDIPVDNRVLSIVDILVKIVSNKYLIYLIIITVVLIILLMVINKSWLIGIKKISVPLIISSINIGITCILFRMLEMYLEEHANVHISIISNTIIIIMVSELILGILLIVLYKLLKKKGLE